MIRKESLEIGKLIHELLDPIIPTYPIIAEEGAGKPFAVYRRAGLEGRDTKDLYRYKETVSLEVIVTADEYARGVDSAAAVKQTLEGYVGMWNGARVDIDLVNADEDWSDNAFIQRLYFTVRLDYSR